MVLQGCLKDNEVEGPEFSFNKSEEIIHYLESQGDFINSIYCPATIDADELYNNINNYLIVDIRSSDKYMAGHIENSINISHQDLFNVLDSAKYSNYEKVIIVSLNGQASAYYTSLLRIAGYSNTYSLYYGLACWNPDFSNEWLKAIYSMDQNHEFAIEDFEKNQFASLPEVKYDNTMTIREKIKDRAIALSKLEFSENNENVTENFISIGRKPFMNRFRNNINDYLVCLTSRAGYVYSLGPGATFKHLVGAVHYMPPAYSDFTSSKFLQTVPKNRKTVIYSYDGVLSAFFTAYLNFLGYDTASYLYGLNAISHDYLNSIPPLKEYYFNTSLIRSYPYITQ